MVYGSVYQAVVCELSILSTRESRKVFHGLLDHEDPRNVSNYLPVISQKTRIFIKVLPLDFF
jgi:hypothetical protein